MDKLTRLVEDYDQNNIAELLRIELPYKKQVKIKPRYLKKIVNITKHKLYKQGIMSFGFKL